MTQRPTAHELAVGIISGARVHALSELGLAVVYEDELAALRAAASPSAAATALGKLGGIKGGKARATSLTHARRVEIARAAAVARWKKSGGVVVDVADLDEVAAAHRAMEHAAVEGVGVEVRESSPTTTQA